MRVFGMYRIEDEIIHLSLTYPHNSLHHFDYTSQIHSLPSLPRYRSLSCNPIAPTLTLRYVSARKEPVPLVAPLSPLAALETL